VIFVAVTAVFWNEARKEVVFLCGNFVKGVSKNSVLKQLDTGTFLRYRSEAVSSGSYIEVDSKVNLSVYKCRIYFDSDGIVINARIE